MPRSAGSSDVAGPHPFTPSTKGYRMEDLKASVRAVCAEFAAGGPLPLESVNEVLRVTQVLADEMVHGIELGRADAGRTLLPEMAFALVFYLAEPRFFGIRRERWPVRALDEMLATYDGSPAMERRLQRWAPIVAWLLEMPKLSVFGGSMDDLCGRPCIIADEHVARAIARGPERQRFAYPVRVAFTALPAFTVQGPNDCRPVVLATREGVAFEAPVLTVASWRSFLRPGAVLERTWLPKQGYWYARVVDDAGCSDGDSDSEGGEAATGFYREITGEFRPTRTGGSKYSTLSQKECQFVSNFVRDLVPRNTSATANEQREEERNGFRDRLAEMLRTRIAWEKAAADDPALPDVAALNPTA